MRIDKWSILKYAIAFSITFLFCYFLILPIAFKTLDILLKPVIDYYNSLPPDQKRDLIAGIIGVFLWFILVAIAVQLFLCMIKETVKQPITEARE